MIIQIQPVSVYPNTATQVEFKPAEVTFGTGALSQYILQDTDGNNLISNVVEMTPTQYASWGTNDNYAIDCFLTNLGLTRA